MEKESSCAYKTKKKMALALKDLMRTTAFDHITVADITDSCELHRQTFYYHFQDRYQLLDWLIYHELFVPFVEGINRQNVYTRFYQLFLTLCNDKTFYSAALRVDMRELTQQITQTAKQHYELIMSGLNTDEAKSPVDDSTCVFADFFCYGISGIVLDWALNGMKETPEEMTNKIKHLAGICKKIAGR